MYKKEIKFQNLNCDILGCLGNMRPLSRTVLVLAGRAAAHLDNTRYVNSEYDTADVPSVDIDCHSRTAWGGVGRRSRNLGSLTIH